MVPLWAFIAVTVPLVLVPGASTAVVLRNSIAGGTRAGLQTVVGVNAGSFCYGVLSGLGVALALQRWPGLWTALRAGGILYLAWLGAQSLRRAARPVPASLPGLSPPPGTPGRAGRHLREGFLTNALNPAIATFYFVVVPQFVPRGAPAFRAVLLLTSVHVTLAAAYHVLWAAAGGSLARVLSSGRPRRVLDAIAGVALLTLSASLALG